VVKVVDAAGLGCTARVAWALLKRYSDSAPRPAVLDTFFHDIRLAARALIRARGFAAITVATLAIGIGANMATFALVDGVLFRPMQVANPDNLVWITEVDGRGRQYGALGYPSYRAYRSVRSFSAVAAYDNAFFSLGGDSPERVRGALVSANYFDLLGFPLALGRSFRSEEDSVLLAHPVAIISRSLWERRFGSDTRVLDSTLRVNGHVVAIVGVAERGIRDLDNESQATDVWLPMAMVPIARPSTPDLLDQRNAGWVRVVARLAPGVTRVRAEAEAAVAARGTRDAEDSLDVRRTSLAAAVGAMDPSNRREAAPILGLVSLVPLLVLLVAGFNIVNLQLAQGIKRRREFAVRRALGATRRRLVRQLLTESVLLALIACAVSVWVSYGFIWVIGRLGEFPAFILDLMNVDGRVIAAAAALAFVAGLGVGVVPALVASGDELTPALKNESSALRLGEHRHRLRDAVVVAQVAVSVVLLVTAGLFLRSLDKAVTVDLGFNPRGAVMASFDLSTLGYTPQQRAALQQRILDDVGGMPRVDAAAIASTIPFGGRVFATSIRDGATASDAGSSKTFISSVSPAYFRAVGIRVTKGREFTRMDDAGAPLVAIVDEALAARLWPGREPLGLTLRRWDGDPPREVVGVVRTALQDELTEAPPGTVYFPEAQFPADGAQTLIVRTARPAAEIAGVIQHEIGRIDPNVPLYDAASFDAVLTRAISGHRAASAMLGVFGALALVLAAVGMFGVTAHAVSSRTREIGIRVSLGARTVDIIRLFVGAGLGHALIGVALGIAASAALSRVLSGFLFGLSATDATTFVAAALILCGVAMLASFLPARRAARVEPTVALRAE
jgi:putative ABC transport system permease protein